MYANIPNCPSFGDLDETVPIMDLDITTPPPGYRRGVNGEREVEEWGLKVQKLANVHSVTLLFVSYPDAYDHSLAGLWRVNEAGYEGTEWSSVECSWKTDLGMSGH